MTKKPILPAAATRFAKRVQAMLDDPECTGDLLVIGVAMAEAMDLGTTPSEWPSIKRRAIPSGDAFRRAIAADVRRYDALMDADTSTLARLCGAPMVRRQGPCEKQATRRTLITDPDTGRRQWLAACTRHQEWFTRAVIAYRDAAADIEVVDPPPNAGGVLEKHFPDVQWVDIYQWARPGWTEPGEHVEKPRLVVIKGGAA